MAGIADGNGERKRKFRRSTEKRRNGKGNERSDRGGNRSASCSTVVVICLPCFV